LRIRAFEGTVAELLAQEGTKIYVRGIRNGVDLDYENANFYASKKLDKDITAVYLPCPQELLHVSSTMVRNSLKFGTPIDEYVSEKVKAYLER
jgi:pantetheine-phosphate adenylyltransferase